MKKLFIASIMVSLYLVITSVGFAKDQLDNCSSLKNDLSKFERCVLKEISLSSRGIVSDATKDTLNNVIVDFLDEGIAGAIKSNQPYVNKNHKAITDLYLKLATENKLEISEEVREKLNNFIVSIFFSSTTSDGKPRTVIKIPEFTPAEQTMIIFYTNLVENDKIEVSEGVATTLNAFITTIAKATMRVQRETHVEESEYLAFTPSERTMIILYTTLLTKNKLKVSEQASESLNQFIASLFEVTTTEESKSITVVRSANFSSAESTIIILFTTLFTNNKIVVTSEVIERLNKFLVSIFATTITEQGISITEVRYPILTPAEQVMIVLYTTLFKKEKLVVSEEAITTLNQFISSIFAATPAVTNPDDRSTTVVNPAFTPSEQTMILLYKTLFEK